MKLPEIGKTVRNVAKRWHPSSKTQCPQSRFCHFDHFDHPNPQNRVIKSPETPQGFNPKEAWRTRHGCWSRPRTWRAGRWWCRVVGGGTGVMGTVHGVPVHGVPVPGVQWSSTRIYRVLPCITVYLAFMTSITVYLPCIWPLWPVLPCITVYLPCLWSILDDFMTFRWFCVNFMNFRWFHDFSVILCKFHEYSLWSI